MSNVQDRPQRVLVVDDNTDIVRVIQRILSHEGYELSTAYDGEDALAAARKDKPDLVLLDVMIPKIDGLQVCRELKSHDDTKSMMIILVTGRGSLDHLVQGFEAGADDYIPKPFHLPELLARTRSALRIKSLTDDLAERNRLLVRQQTELVQKEKMATIGLLASGIAHEFNNIMAGVSGYAQLARKNPKYQEMLVEVALTQARRAFELTKSLSTYNRASPNEGCSKVAEVINGVLCLVMKEFQKSGVSLETDVDEGLVAAIGPGQLQEILLNLLINALHAVQDKAGSAETGTIEIRARALDDAVLELRIQDNGAGIPEDDVPRIFDPFFTSKGALGGGSRSGTGLGLTVCYNVVQANSGDIDVESEIGRGTTFTVRLPRTEAPPAPAEEALSTFEAPACRPRLRVLVLDDEPLAQETLTSFLEEHDVVCCSRVEEGLDAHAEKPFEFVILDICLKGPLNGFDAFDRFQAMESVPRVIFASGSFPDQRYRRYLKKAHGHLLKPFKFEDLGALLGLSLEARPRVSPASS